MESILFNIFCALLACIALLVFAIIVLAIDDMTGNKISDFIFKWFEH